MVVRLKMSDIAAMAGVSISTVSRALQNNPLITASERERIQKLALERGYVVNHAARNLRLKTTKTLGLILPLGHETEQRMTDPFLQELTGYLAEEVLHRGYDLLISKNTSPRTDWLKDLVHSHRFDGMFVLGQSDQHEAINALATNYAHMVVWGEKLEGQNYCSVGVDNAYGGFLATDHCLAKGRRKLLYLGPDTVPEVVARRRGFEKAHRDRGFTFHSDQFVPTRFTFDHSITVTETLLNEGREFDGLICASDVIAHGALDTLIKAGRKVPQDVCVTGYDDVLLAQMINPALTTIRQNIALGAKMMVELLFQRLAGEKTSSGLIPATLVIRASS
jgi:DNA-binding LacI/PurR family transcriptional regulator